MRHISSLRQRVGHIGDRIVVRHGARKPLLVAIAFMGLGGAVIYGTTSAETMPQSYTLVGAGDIAMTQTAAEATAKLLDQAVAADPAATVFTTGDNVYESGTDAEFNNLYAPTWGRHRDRTKPTPGNHEYYTANATGYYKYFCPSSTNCVFPGGTQQKYYSYDLGGWHILALNSEVEYQAGSPQMNWIRQELAANAGKCTMAMFHKPYFNSGTSHGRETAMRPFWDELYAGKVDVILNGHEHIYERFAKQDPNGAAAVDGIRQFTVGTGGAALNTLGSVLPNSEVRQGHTTGVLKMTLVQGGYQWQFIPVAGKTFTDSGSDVCNNASGDAFPTVSVTAPAQNSVVSGPAVEITADAGDDTGLAGVQFKIDGADFGSEDTEAPYAVTWDTTTAAEGRHTITAVARDSSGKTTTSQVINTTVDNVIDVTTVIETRTMSSADDAEQASNGSVVLNSTDLELVTDASVQNVGMRFAGITVPRGAVIKDAYLQFTSDEEPTSGSAALTLRAEATDNAPAYTTSNNNISNRAKTAAAVTWTPADWPATNEAGPNQRTPDLSGLVQEVVNRNGWNNGNALALTVTGSGKRNAHAYDGSASQAPLLHIEYEIDRSAPTPPYGVTALPQSSNQINLSWNAATDNVRVTDYRIFRNGTQVGTATGTTFNDTGLTASTAYEYRVAAVDSTGNVSDQSIPVTATTLEAPITQTLTFQPVADATINSKSNKTNYGRATTLQVDSSPNMNFLMRFNVSGLAGKQIVSAKIRLFNSDPSPSGGSVYRVANNSWSETGVTWQNAPVSDSTAIDSLGSVTANNPYELNVLPVIGADGTYSFRFKSANSDAASYWSREGAAGTVPLLTVVVQ